MTIEKVCRNWPSGLTVRAFAIRIAVISRVELSLSSTSLMATLPCARAFGKLTRRARLTFQQVEDQLATLRILEHQVQLQEQTVKSANLAEQLTLNRYRAGTVAYTSVVTAQAIALGDGQSLLTIPQNRPTASVARSRHSAAAGIQHLGTRPSTAVTVSADAH